MKLFFQTASMLFCLFIYQDAFAIKPFATMESFTVEGSKWKIFSSENMTAKTVNRQSVYKLSETTDDRPLNADLFLDFENSIKNLPNYRVISANFERNRFQSVNGNYSGKFYFSDNYISLLPLSTSIFAPGNVPGSFTIEFWLYVYKNYDNQYVLKYIGNNLSDENDKNIYGFMIYTKDNFLYYQFENFFWSQNREPYSIEIKEEDEIILNKWEHHAISYNIMDGKIATYKNGMEQEVKWLTKNGKTLSPIFNPLVKEELSTPILIGKNGIFSVDNLKITRNPTDQFYLGKYKNNESYIITDVYKITDNILSLKKIIFNTQVPDYSHLKMAYRISGKYFSPDDTSLDWIYIQNGIENFPSRYNAGKYMQFKITAYPYEDISEDIILSSIKVDYIVDKDPYIPVITKVTALDGRIDISWVPSPEDDIAGYEIYYGNRFHDYISSEASEGQSPIFLPMGETGKITPITFSLTGLINEKPYFLSIRSVDKNGHKSGYSKEVYARPSSVDNDDRYSIGR